MQMTNERYAELEATSRQIERTNQAEERARAGEDHPRKEIEFYICPRRECGSYYGVPGMPDLAKERNKAIGTNFEDMGWRRYGRATCPDCFARDGIEVERVRMKVSVEVPEGAG